ncbi:hypothetical protein DFH05DRAFT_1530474 [Lentinula detonsa]|uniref:CxC1-like cysteine cluster associated with KDZ transposases domain-containing protein n=1 Tax=Lentinula detonsa TaxID=2804962 RepID=A0A9W8NR54_9AGAR|nr:hypothetical protein DFH05DRAFT_1530474 [Lentinula detonsa]
MGRPPKSNIRQRRKLTREPLFSLYDDIDNQPRTSGLVLLNPTQRKQKKAQAQSDFITRRIVQTTSILKRRAAQKHRDGEDDRLYTEVLMELDEDEGPNDDDGSEFMGIPSAGDWEDEDTEEEEHLLYFQAKGAIHDFELTENRSRRNKVILDQERWEEQMPDLVDAYLDHCYRRSLGYPFEEMVKERHTISIWSTYEHRSYDIPVYHCDKLHNASYIRLGFLPFNPLLNHSLVSLQTVELYHHIFMRCPRLGVQPFLRGLCDLQGVRFKNNFGVQFSSAYDFYIRLTESVRLRVLISLDRTTPNWRLLNTCPPCQYEVEGEEPQPIRMMLAVDGNNSLKRFERRERRDDGTLLGPSRERPDVRIGGGDYFLQPSQVDLWDEPNWGKWVDWSPLEKADRNACTDRWSNLNEAKTAKSFGSFDVNGIFAGFCRHSFVLAFSDMIKTGEQSKYLLSLLYHFMSACRDDQKRRGFSEETMGSLGVGYDIACGMVDKIARSPLRQLAKDERLQMLIGLLHGYAHNRLCQLTFLMLYIYGAGIEDLEVCERFFSHSNALASVTRYMSKFRRRQTISSYAYHRDNFETYANLSKFIHSNYRQALRIISRSQETARTLRELGLLDAGKVIGFIDEERSYLESRNSVPEPDVLASSYYRALVKLSDCREKLRRARRTFKLYEMGESCVEGEESLYLSERQMVNELELEAKLLVDVQCLEERLGIRVDQRWCKGSEDWRKAEELVAMSIYQKSLDKLEGLIVARIFELSRMNISGTGYKMRQHIGHAMQKRSTTIRSALEKYNEAAAKLTPPRKLLHWDDVMNYTYLSEFDFLRDTRSDVCDKTWAKPAVREAMSELFKLIRAEEEINRLNMEIKRLITYMKEEEEYVSLVATSVQETNPSLAYQIRRYRDERRRYNVTHRRRLDSIRKLPGFTPTNARYFHAGVGLRRQSVHNHIEEGMVAEDNEDHEDDQEDDSDGDDQESELDDRAEAALAVANDNGL